MEAMTITIPDELVRELEPYRDSIGDLLRIGLRLMKMEQALALFKKGNISLWRAARLADVSLRDMTQYAVSQGLRATVDEEIIKEELA